MQPQHIGVCRTMLPQIIRAQPPQERTGGIAAAAASDRINALTRDTGQVPGPIPSGTAKPRASRRRSRRSSTRPDKRTNARHRPSTRPNPKRHSQAKSVPAAKPPQQHPAGQNRPRETTGLNDCIWHDNSAHARPRTQTTRTRQRRAAQAAQTAVGDAQERILLRDDHLASTTSARFQRTHKKRLFFGV